jgi:hypothetical protein
MNDHTYHVGVTKKGALYKFVLDDIHFRTVEGFTTKLVEIPKGTDLIHVKLGGIDLDMDIDAQLDALMVIPFKSSRVQATNLGIEFTIKTTTPDGVKWRMVEQAKITIGTVKITMANSFLNWCVKQCESIINQVVIDLLPSLGYFIDGKIQQFDDWMAKSNATTYDVPYMGHDYGINLTFTAAPKIGDDLIRVNFDGVFDSIVAPLSPAKKFPRTPKTYRPRLPHAHAQQFWVHQDTFNSMFFQAKDEIFPMYVNSSQISDALIANFPILAGSKVFANISLSANAPFTLTAANGVTINSPAVVTIIANKNGKNTTAKFSATLKGVFDVYMQAFMVYPEIKSLQLSNVAMTQNSIGIDASRDFQTVFNQIIKDASAAYNEKYQDGWAVANLDPQIGMLGGLLGNATLTPHVSDNWLYGGWTMYADLPTAVAPELAMI